MPKIQLDEVSLHYEEQGVGSPLLLLHGLGSTAADWDEVAPRLAEKHRLIAPDVRGHGRSDKPPGAYNVPLFAADLAAFCDRRGLSGIHVAGISMGGMLAFELAVRRPDLVRSLVIVNSGPDMVPRSLRFRMLMATRLLLLRVLGPAGLARILAGKLFPRPEQAEQRRRIEERLGRNDRDAYLRATRGLIGWTVLDELPAIACPVLVLASDGDYTPVADKQAYLGRLKHAQLEVIRDSGHAATADQPEQVAEAMLRFLGRVESASPRVFGAIVT